MAICDRTGLADFYLAYGHLELARIYRAKGGIAQANLWLESAKAIAMTDPEDAKHFQEDIVEDGWEAPIS